MRVLLSVVVLLIVLFVAFLYLDGVQRQRAADAWEMHEPADYESKKKEYDALEAAFRKECGDFIAIGSLEPTRRAAALRRLEPRHAKKCDDSAGVLNALALALKDAIQRGRERERVGGIR